MNLMNERMVRKILCNIFDRETCDDISIKDDLQYIGMDSLNCMELIIALEENFQIEIPEDKLGLKFICTIYDICKLIEKINADK